MRYLLFFVFITIAQCREGYDYYWRDFDGTIPGDAVLGHYDKNRNIALYIGQHIHKCYLVPGAIYPSDNGKFIGEYFGKFEAISDIKILCSRNNDTFKWVSVEDATVLPTEEPYCISVPGGYEYNKKNKFRWLIGKVFHEGEWKISKVDFHILKGVSVWKSSGSYEFIKKFELLKVCSIHDVLW